MIRIFVGAAVLTVVALIFGFHRRQSSELLKRKSSFSIDFRKLSRLCGAEMDDAGPFGRINPLTFMSTRSSSGSAAPIWIDQLENKSIAPEEMIHPTQEDDSQFDWQDEGAVSKTVHDQGSLGTCAAFAAVANIEGQRFLHGDGKLVDLSVEQIIECSAETDQKKDESNCGVFGGWPKLVLDYVKKRGGLASDRDWPYCAGTLNPVYVPACFPCMPQGYSREGCDDHDDDFYCDANSTIGQNKKDGWCTSKSFRPAVSISEVLDFTDTENEEILKKHLIEIGPLAVTLSIGPLQFYRRGILDPPALLCARTGRPEHVVLLTGFGVANGKPYWRLKNSWGVAFGEKGFFRLARGKNSCGIGRFQVTSAKGIKVFKDHISDVPSLIDK